MKELDEMSLEELWQLFPIELVESKKEWTHWYEEISNELVCLIGPEFIFRISHIGSTSIPNIKSKNIVDVLVEIPNELDLKDISNELVGNDYIEMSQSENRISLNKGYTPFGFAEKVYHIHLRYKGDHDELYFRDYLIEFPDEAIRYEKLKIGLADQFKHNRDNYTTAKTEFIKKITGNAKKKYLLKYE